MGLITTYRAKRSIKIGPGQVVLPGEIVPQAHLSRLVSGQVHSGFLVEVQAEAPVFIEAVRKMRNEGEQERVLEAVGLDMSALDDPDNAEAEQAQVKHPPHTPQVDVPEATRIDGPVGPPIEHNPTKRAPRKAPEKKLHVGKKAPEKPSSRPMMGSPDIPQRSLLEEGDDSGTDE